jgi:thiosulfate/3-mercaptopyruvate sulfurtransferase
VVELRKIFAAQGIDLSGKRETIIYCGSGVSSCIPSLALEILGVSNLVTYDGSWSEYVSYI